MAWLKIDHIIFISVVAAGIAAVKYRRGRTYSVSISLGLAVITALVTCGVCESGTPMLLAGGVLLVVLTQAAVVAGIITNRFDRRFIPPVEAALVLNAPLLLFTIGASV
ncbi:MAG: hypothetical protein AB7F40_05085 [Victivallaceae bacterium]